MSESTVESGRRRPRARLRALGVAGLLVMGGCGEYSTSGGSPAAYLAALLGYHSGVGVAAQNGLSARASAATRGQSTTSLAQLAQAANGPEDRVFLVQLASVTSEQEAIRQWDRLRADFPGLLDSNELVIERVELGGRGTFHRVQTGPFLDLVTAEKLCSQFKKRAQDCLVVQTSMDYQVMPEPAAGEPSSIPEGEDQSDSVGLSSDELFQQFLEWRKKKREE